MLCKRRLLQLFTHNKLQWSAPPKEESIYWWSYFNTCNDISSNTTFSKYCGASYLIINDEVVTIELPIVDLGYSLPNLHCLFHLTNPKKDNAINIKSTMMSDYDTFLLDIFAVFTDGTTAYKNINAAQSSVSYDKISTLDIHFLSYERIAVFLFN